MDGEHLVSGKVWRGPTPREEQRTVKRDEREREKKKESTKTGRVAKQGEELFSEISKSYDKLIGELLDDVEVVANNSRES